MLGNPSMHSGSEVTIFWDDIILRIGSIFCVFNIYWKLGTVFQLIIINEDNYIIYLNKEYRNIRFIGVIFKI